MYSKELRLPARKALVILVGEQLLERVEASIFSKAEIFPAHLLSVNLTEDSGIVLDLLKNSLETEQGSK